MRRLTESSKNYTTSWDAELKAAYEEEATARARASAEVEKLAKGIRETHDAAMAAREDAEATFDKAERRLSTSLAREGCAKAIAGWDLHEAAIRQSGDGTGEEVVRALPWPTSGKLRLSSISRGSSGQCTSDNQRRLARCSIGPRSLQWSREEHVKHVDARGVSEGPLSGRAAVGACDNSCRGIRAPRSAWPWWRRRCVLRRELRCAQSWARWIVDRLVPVTALVPRKVRDVAGADPGIDAVRDLAAFGGAAGAKAGGAIRAAAQDSPEVRLSEVDCEGAGAAEAWTSAGTEPAHSAHRCA